MNEEEERRYGELSPFELRTRLIELAGRSGRPVLNAARANPNWVALEPRQAFAQLGVFALEQSAAGARTPGFGRARLADGLHAAFARFAAQHRLAPGIEFLSRSLDYAAGTLDIDRESLVQELAGAVLGSHYPAPPRMLPACERIMQAFVGQALLQPCGAEGFDLFAVEGVTAGAAYAFDSLFQSGLLAKGDRIAIGTPIFAPYLEMPLLGDYELVEVKVRQDEARGWHYPVAELDRLRDPSVKAFLLVNPSNPTGASLDAEATAHIAAIVRESRPDLVVISDDVYATFAPRFSSLAAEIPANTVLLYSCSKFWGATGWRLAVVALHRDNVLDERIRALPAPWQDRFRERYRSIAADPSGLRFIDRMVADSRRVGFNHTAGLSTPQQAQMALFALHALLDEAGEYTRQARALVRRRFEALHAGAGLPIPGIERNTHYYATVDVVEAGRARHGNEFGGWLGASVPAIDFVVRLAEEKGVVLLDAGGFDAPRLSVRVSLANLEEPAYGAIGKAIAELLEEYHADWVRAGRPSGDPARRHR